MPSFGKRVDVPGGRRQAKRKPVTILGAAVSIEGTKSVVVEDLCPTGAKLVGRGLPQPGRELLVRAGDLEVLGRVAWADDDYRGIRFEEPLPEQA